MKSLSFAGAALCMVVLLLTGVASAGVLVLTNGSQMDVKQASVEGSFVHVAFESGQMQAYPIEEVDLEASGLLPKTEADDGKPKERAPRGLASARSPESGQSGTTITDKDVSHVRPVTGTPTVDEEGEPGADKPAVALAISDTKHQVAGSVVNLTGKVHNAGTQDVAMIIINAAAIDSKGVSIGTGTTTIAQKLPSGQEMVFAVSFPFQGKIADIKVSAQASVANFEFQKKTVEPEDDQ